MSDLMIGLGFMGAAVVGYFIGAVVGYAMGLARASR